MRNSFLYALLSIVFLFGCSAEDPDTAVQFDLRLTALAVSTGSLAPPFAPDIREYILNVASSVESIDLSGSSPDGNITYTPPMPAVISTGSNLVTVQSVSPDLKETNTIRIIVYRPSSNASLSSLSISSGTLSPPFSPDITRYYSYLPASTASVSVLPSAAADASIITIPAQPATLTYGSNRITIRVTAADGNTTREYLVELYRLGDEYTSVAIGTMRYVPGGSFQRDSESDNISTVSPFRISATEITRHQYTNVTGLPDPSSTGYSTGMDDPVQQVNWYGTLLFCNRLSILEGLQPVYSIGGSTNPDDWGAIPNNNNSTWNSAAADWNATGYRLPTEMEWMWAAMDAQLNRDPRAVNTTGYSGSYAGASIAEMGTLSMDDFCWYTANSGTKTQPVGTKLPNGLGIYDMSGNVWEWCWDRRAPLPTGGVADYNGPADGILRIVHGGDWSASTDQCAIAFRNSVNPHFRSDTVGFRVVRK